jgi:hypothetical protein
MITPINYFDLMAKESDKWIGGKLEFESGGTHYETTIENIFYRGGRFTILGKDFNLTSMDTNAAVLGGGVNSYDLVANGRRFKATVNVSSEV